MQVRCIRPRAGVKVGDLAEVPDGATVSDLYWEVVEPPPPPAAAAKTADTPKAGM
jgi:hypothetical protein